MAYLTKSRFKLGLECPTKLFYDSHREVYFNQRNDDPFMDALAKGGFQVGELAKLYYPDGLDIDTLNTKEAVRLTEEALKKDEVTIFEAAFKVGHRLIRVDVLQKTKNQIRLIEVKSKSSAGDDLGQFQTQKGSIAGNWRSYLEDVAFQYCLVEDYFNAIGETRPIVPYLMLTDKTAQCSVDGLHEFFLLLEDEKGRHYCKPKEGVSRDELGTKILLEIPVPELVQQIIDDTQYENIPGWKASGFKNIIQWFEELLVAYEKDEDGFYGPVGAHCKGCQFQTDNHKPVDSLISGFEHCFSLKKGWSESELSRQLVWGIWNFRKTSEVIESGKWFMNELEEEDILSENKSLQEPIPGDGLEPVQRQWQQISESKSQTLEPYIDVEGLANEIASLIAPFHFIDFETTAPAIPFYKGYRPYQGICFQFSHHTIDENGEVEHAGEYLGLGQGKNPSFEFIELLYEELRHDQGTVFMYSSHENTYLNFMIELLMSNSPFEKVYTNQLIDFLKSIAKPTGNSAIQWEEGPRMMVDMAKMVRSYYWHPMMKGSNSIKQVLPAVMNSSDLIKQKYGRPIYGATNEIDSFNFIDFSWVQYDNEGLVTDPYKLLPELNEILPMKLSEMERLFTDETVGNGGAAMTAWAYMQFSEMQSAERDAIAKALKCYCELDTLAMVMIWEHFNELIEQRNN